VTRYGYDPLGRRLFKQTQDRRTLFYWDGDALLGESVVELNPSREPVPAPENDVVSLTERWEQAQGGTRQKVREYAYYPETFEPVALLDGVGGAQRVCYYHNDLNGCPARLLDASGQALWSAQYSAWGAAVRVHVTQLDNPIRMQGQYADEETGLHYTRYRYCEPSLGMFVSQDPLGIIPGETLYLIAHNLTGWADPLGLVCERLTGHHLLDRIAQEIDEAVLHASRMLDRGMHGRTPWGRIYQNLVKHNPNHWLVPIVRGNAVQQIADTMLRQNRYLREAGVIFNQGHLHGLRNARGNLVRPDYQVPLAGGRLGIIDVTRSAQGPKISKYIDPSSPGSNPATNVFY
jgi:RHS repeat-associated protein